MKNYNFEDCSILQQITKADAQTRQWHRTKTHQNVMEVLVDKEVERQWLQLSPRLTRYINPIEVAVIALNHLPPMYVSSEQEQHHQQLTAKVELSELITTTVSQAFAAVVRDPIKFSNPLLHTEETESQAIQEALQAFLHYHW
ncbi:MAG: late competence development ComFB family protein [Symploca sp. SIO2B6]|nr:late competence development ComFB family protein [Symploca sp. SIO2B6]